MRSGAHPQHLTISPIDLTDGLGLIGSPNCCCCCAEDLIIQDVARVSGRMARTRVDTFGHKFSVRFRVKYIKDPVSRTDCSVQWWEKTNRPNKPQIPADTWVDRFHDNAHNSNMFGDWFGRKKQCPGNDPGYFRDEPRMPMTASMRTLFFAIRIKSGEGCPCNSSEITVYATQVLDTNGHGRPTIWVFSRGMPQSQLPVPN